MIDQCSITCFLQETLKSSLNFMTMLYDFTFSSFIGPLRKDQTVIKRQRQNSPNSSLTLYTTFISYKDNFPMTTDHAAAFVNIPLSTYQKASRKKCIVKSHNNLTLQYFHMYHQPSNVKEA
jgi:hypothetical protein